MKRIIIGAVLAVTVAAPVWAQEPVTPASEAEQLFTSPDPKLNSNKQVVYHIIRDLLAAGHWDKADQYLTDDYIQHNPNARSGRAAVVDYFTKVLKMQPRPIPSKLDMKIVSVVAEGDLVTVMYPRTVKDAAAPGSAYTTTWFDTWRIEDGKAAEHWDPALRNEAPDLR